MAYIDKIKVGGVDYDIQDTSLKSAFDDTTEATFQNINTIVKEIPSTDRQKYVPFNFEANRIYLVTVSADVQFPAECFVHLYNNATFIEVLFSIPIRTSGATAFIKPSANGDRLVFAYPNDADRTYTVTIKAVTKFTEQNYSNLLNDIFNLNNGLMRIETTKNADLTKGQINNDGTINTGTNTRIYTVPYYPVKKGDFVVASLPNLAIKVAFYNTSKVLVDSMTDFSCPDMSRSKLYRWILCEQDGYIRLSVLDYNQTNIASHISDYDNVATIIHRIDGNYARVGYRNYPTRINHKPGFINYSDIYQDGTVIDGKLWLFSDGQSASGEISVINIDTGTLLESKTHQLGHANSVDYNVNNDTLITYGSKGDNQPTLVLYKNPSASDDLQLSDANCMQINLFKESSYLNPSASLCWGEDDQTVYYMTGFYTDAALTKANKNEIYKIILGKGTNDFSSDGYGTFISGKASTEYNGTCKIIKTYSGDVMPYRDVEFSAANAISTPQGMVYDGYIYVGWSYSGNNFVKIELDDVRSEYHVVDNYLYRDYGTDQTTPIVYEPEVTAIYNKKLICGSHSQNANKSLLMVFEL